MQTIEQTVPTDMRNITTIKEEEQDYDQDEISKRQQPNLNKRIQYIDTMKSHINEKTDETKTQNNFKIWKMDSESGLVNITEEIECPESDEQESQAPL